MAAPLDHIHLNTARNSHLANRKTVFIRIPFHGALSCAGQRGPALGQGDMLVGRSRVSDSLARVLILRGDLEVVVRRNACRVDAVGDIRSDLQLQGVDELVALPNEDVLAVDAHLEQRF